MSEVSAGDGFTGQEPYWLPNLDDRTTTRIVLLLLVAGCALRLVWALNGHLEPVNSEAFFVARALAEGRGFSEAFGLGTGPTAHLMPLTPVPATLVYSLLGAGTPAAEFVLSVWATACVAASIFVGERVMRELGVGPYGRTTGVAVASLAPIQVALEVSAFRVWEVGLATLASLATLLLILRLDRSGRIGWRTLVGVGALNALVFLISPAAALGTSGMIGIWLLRRVPFLRWPVPVLTAIVIVAAVAVPWGLRNEHALGKFVPLRTGEGMQLAIAYHDGRLSPDIQAANLRRFREVSPLMGEAARARYVEIGEVAYNRDMAALAEAWQDANRSEVWKIRFSNFVQFYFPPSWLWARFTPERLPEFEPRRVFTAVVAAVGILTLGAMLVARRARWIYVLPLLLLPSLPYVMTYPTLRYRYLISTLVILLAAHGAMLALAALTNRGKRPPRPLDPPSGADDKASRIAA